MNKDLDVAGLLQVRYGFEILRSVLFDKDDLVLQAFQRRLVIDSDTDTGNQADYKRAITTSLLESKDLKKEKLRKQVKAILKKYEYDDKPLNDYKRRVLQGIKSSNFQIIQEKDDRKRLKKEKALLAHSTKQRISGSLKSSLGNTLQSDT